MGDKIGMVEHSNTITGTLTDGQAEMLTTVVDVSSSIEVISVREVP